MIFFGVGVCGFGEAAGERDGALGALGATAAAGRFDRARVLGRASARDGIPTLSQTYARVKEYMILSQKL